MAGMRMAKPDEKQFDDTRAFLNAAESFWENRRYSFNSGEDDWKELDDEDDTKIQMLKIQKELAKDEDCDITEVDNRLVVYEFLKSKYRQCDYCWGRVLMAGEIAINSACDPTLNYLDFLPGTVFNHVQPEQ